MIGYRQIAVDLGQKIAAGEFRVGEVLPSEKTLAERYSCARGTIRRALGRVAETGAISSRQGSGWIVESGRQRQSFSQLRSFAQWAENKGSVPGGRVVSITQRPVTFAENRRLRVGIGAPVTCVERVRTLNGHVVMLERTVYPEWMGKIIAAIDPEAPSVIHELEHVHGIHTVHADHLIDAVAASSADARVLGIRRSSALLRLRRASYTRDGRCMELGEDRYLPGAIAFQVSASDSRSNLRRASGYAEASWSAPTEAPSPE